MKHYIGRNQHKDRVFIEINLSKTTVSESAFCCGADGNERREIVLLSVMGGEIRYRCSTVSSCGQINMHLSASDIEPAKGWTREDIKSLFRIWDAWHLNDMRAYCGHMDLTEVGTSYDERKAVTCPVTGRAYGSRWWAVEIPADVLAEIERLDRLP